jgi:hypothetical protein
MTYRLIEICRGAWLWSTTSTVSAAFDSGSQPAPGRQLSGE